MTTTEWDVKPTAGHDTHGQSVIWDEDGKAIAIVYDGDSHGRLIAAAPEMLDALKKLQDALAAPVHGNSPRYSEAWEAMQAAIRKAEEGQ
jgi:glyoxylase-like metal-dependent hydrolase (beta-lactamase superfamily II)